MAAAISPLAPKSFPSLPYVEGVRFATGAAGIRDNDRTDVMLGIRQGHAGGGGFLRNRHVRRQARRRTKAEAIRLALVRTTSHPLASTVLPRA